MSDNKDYTQWTLEALLAEEKKIKKSEIISATIIGFLIGVMIYGIVKGGFKFFFLVLFILFITNQSKQYKENLKQIRAAIDAKKER